MPLRLSRTRRRLSVVLAGLLLAPSWALAKDEPPPKPPPDASSGPDYDEMTPMEIRLEAVRLRKAIERLDRQDTAAGYGFALRREARALVGGGLGVIAATLAVSGLALLSEPTHGGAPVVATMGVPLGLGVVVAGLPAMILGPRFLGWYAQNGPAPSQLARLKLLHRWSMEELRVRRDTAMIATGFFGAASILTLGVWAGRDRVGVNGPPGANYDGADAITALSFLAVTSAEGAMALGYSFQYRDALKNKHRLFLMPTVSLSPVESARSMAERLDAAPPESGLQLRGGLQITF